MGYATEAQVRQSIGGLTDAAVDQLLIEEAIEEASSVIDSYCASRYSVPFSSPVPYIIRRICKDLSAWYVFIDTIPSGRTVQDDVKVLERYRRAMSDLKRIKDGDLIVVGATTTSTKKLWSNTKSYAPVFDMDDELNWGVDSNELDDIEDTRDDAGSTLPKDH